MKVGSGGREGMGSAAYLEMIASRGKIFGLKASRVSALRKSKTLTAA
jgi:hypothetical protein